MAWQPQLWAGSPGVPISVSGRGIDAWPAQFGLTGAVFLLEICLDFVKADQLGSRLNTGAARVQASVADQTWRGMTSRFAL